MKIVHERFKDFEESHCWQYEMRVRNLPHDLQTAGISAATAATLRTDDFIFSYVPKDDKTRCVEIKEFIERHEWLGKLSQRSTHRFTAKLKNGTLAGVVIMAVPNTFSNLLGRENRDKEKLISRGACISWAPKNLASWLITRSIKWMVKNTQFRYFTAYSDPEAKELGTIYQACNFYYLGQTSGTTHQYLDPAHPAKGWFSDRDFRKKSKYFKYAEAIGITRDKWKTWMKKYSPDWEKVPPDIKIKIKEQERLYRDSCEKRAVPSKHKYCYILGQTKSETKHLKNIYAEYNPDKVSLSYPKNRGK